MLLLVIKEKLNFASATIKDVIKYYKNTSKVKLPSRSGRKPILTECDKRHLIHVVKEDRKVPLNVLKHQLKFLHILYDQSLVTAAGGIDTTARAICYIST
ncbi:10967_t:CDS:2 [Funneliformis mosseae]|uniref:10967_t:CDS:1 n=1 Tax=Funneliformis mosseae TaxID=27381 RepID=A0A9N9G3I1_FUNMO|nr:10967_t:CDS:2 [Funneliformis mosseae]